MAHSIEAQAAAARSPAGGVRGDDSGPSPSPRWDHEVPVEAGHARHPARRHHRPAETGVRRAAGPLVPRAARRIRARRAAVRHLPAPRRPEHRLRRAAPAAAPTGARSRPADVDDPLVRAVVSPVPRSGPERRPNSSASMTHHGNTFPPACRDRGGQPRHPWRSGRAGATLCVEALARDGYPVDVHSDQSAVSARAFGGCAALPYLRTIANQALYIPSLVRLAARRRRARVLRVVLVLPARPGSGDRSSARALQQASRAPLSQRRSRRPPRPLGHARPSVAEARGRDRRALGVPGWRLRAAMAIRRG